MRGKIGMCCRCTAEIAWSRTGAYKLGSFKRPPPAESDAERGERQKQDRAAASALNPDSDIFHD